MTLEGKESTQWTVTRGKLPLSRSSAAPGRCQCPPPPVLHMCLLESVVSQRFTRCCKDRDEELQPHPQEAPGQ